MKHILNTNALYSILTLEEKILDEYISPHLKSFFLEFDKEKYPNLILDLSNVENIDASGLSSLLVGNRLFTQDGRNLIFCGLNNNVLKLVKISQIDKVMEITTDVKKAVSILINTSSRVAVVHSSIKNEDLDNFSFSENTSQLDSSSNDNIYLHCYLYLDSSSLELGILVFEKLKIFIEYEGLLIDSEQGFQLGSIIKKFLLKAKIRSDYDRIIETLINNFQTVTKTSSNQSENAAELIKSLGEIPNALLKVGSLIIIKRTVKGNTSLFARSLSEKEILFLEKNPQYLNNPNEALESLNRLNKNS